MVDLLLRNVKLANESKVEIGITSGIISHIGEHLDVVASKVFSAPDGTYVSAGWIDAHVHCYEDLDLYYDIPDEIGVKKGVCTLVDAGSSGEHNIEQFLKHTESSITNVYALLNISKDGIIAQNELEDLTKIDINKDVERIKELSNFVIGIKARMSKTVVGENNVLPLIMAKKIQSNFPNLPLMVHIGSAPPNLEDIVEILEKEDIITHCYNGKPNGILDENGIIKDFVLKAYKDGIYFDVGHGTDSFNFDVAQKAIQQGLIAHTISSDIYIRNRLNGPVYDLSTTLSKMLLLGITLESCIQMVTINPAKMYGLKSKGRLEISCDADLTLFKLDSSERVLTDSNGNQRLSKKNIVPTYTVLGGKIYNIGEFHGSL